MIVEMEEILPNARRDVKPLMVKAGFALAISVAGYIFSEIRSRQASSTAAATTRHRSLLSPSGEVGGGQPLQERERNSSEQATQVSHASTPKRMETTEKSEMEKEIASLRDMVHSLQEREKSLEFQLLEYHGLKKQDAAVRELQNRVKLSTVEAKIFALKIESLQADNRRLQAKISDHSMIVAELEVAKERIKVLQEKVKSDSKHVAEMAVVWHRIQDVEDVDEVLKRLKDLESEAAKLRQENYRLMQVNLDLTKKLESDQVVASTMFDTSEITDANHLRKRNKELLKELEQLQIDHCTDVEELVYLRWVNACLRYELKNYQQPEGKTVARDLSMSLSPKSEEKAKQLILEYANLGNDEKTPMDSDSECCSSSQRSSVTEIEELDDDYIAARNSTSSSKVKFLNKLKKLALGKEAHRNRFSSMPRTHSSSGNSGRSASASNCYCGRSSFGSISSSMTKDRARGNRLMQVDPIIYQDHQHQKLQCLKSQETREVKQRCQSDLGSTLRYKRFFLGEQSVLNTPHSDQLGHYTYDSPEKAELKKFASVLKSNRW